MKQGIYKICKVKHDGDDTKKSHLGRIAVVNGHTQILEDSKDGFLHHLFPDGAVDAQKEKRWRNLAANPYYRVQTEGLVTDDSQDMPQPQVKPEEVFDLIDQNGQKRLLEAFGENLFIDGKRLHHKEVAELQRLIHGGTLHLLPREAQ